MKNNKGFIEAFLIIVMIIITIGIFVIATAFKYGNEQTIICTIKEKWIKRPSGSKEEKYLISCDDKVYKIEDLLFKGKFNSADIYAGLETGKTYKITTTGYRFGFFSEYQNINSYELIEEKEGK